MITTKEIMRRKLKVGSIFVQVLKYRYGHDTKKKYWMVMSRKNSISVLTT